MIVAQTTINRSLTRRQIYALSQSQDAQLLEQLGICGPGQSVYDSDYYCSEIAHRHGVEITKLGWTHYWQAKRGQEWAHGLNQAQSLAKLLLLDRLTLSRRDAL